MKHRQRTAETRESKTYLTGARVRGSPTIADCSLVAGSSLMRCHARAPISLRARGAKGVLSATCRNGSIGHNSNGLIREHPTTCCRGAQSRRGKCVCVTYPLYDVQPAALLLHVDLNVVVGLQSGSYVKTSLLQDLHHRQSGMAEAPVLTCASQQQKLLCLQRCLWHHSKPLALSKPCR